MAQYLSLGGPSGITTYEISDDSITVGFKNGSLYLYNYTKPGRVHVEEMKKLAQAGQGLNSYIDKHVRKNYAAKVR